MENLLCSELPFRLCREEKLRDEGDERKISRFQHDCQQYSNCIYHTPYSLTKGGNDKRCESNMNYPTCCFNLKALPQKFQRGSRIVNAEDIEFKEQTTACDNRFNVCTENLHFF